MAERMEDAGRRGGTRQLFLGLESFFQRQLWPARLGLVVAALTIAILLGALLFSYASKLYGDWRETRLGHEAASMLQEGKFSEAAQTARELLGRHPDSLPALYVLAEAAERQNLEEAVSWREQIARLLPKDRDRAASHVVAGWLARAEGNFAEQEEQFAAAVKKEPNNDLYQFNLA